MRTLTRLLASATAGLLVMALAAPAQGQPTAENETPFVPLQLPTQAELARRQALELYAQAMCCQRHDRLLEAIHLLEQAVPLDPEAAPLPKALLPLYSAFGRLDEALAVGRKVLELDPGDEETWMLQARLLKKVGRPSEARSALLRAAACSGLAEQRDVRLQLYHDLGSLSEAMQDWEGALAAFTELARLLDDPQTAVELSNVDHADLSEEAASIYERMIQLCLQAQQHARAIQIFGEAQAKHAELARRLNYALAKAYLAQGQAAQALQHLDAYLETQPLGAEAYELRSQLLQQLGRANETLPALEKYAERDRFNVSLKLFLARQYAVAGQAGHAEQLYTALAEQTPSAEVFSGMFALYRQRGELDKVLDLLDEALSKSEKEGGPPAGAAQAAARARAMLTTLREDPGLIQSVLPAAQRALLRGRSLHPQLRYLIAVLAARGHQLAEAEFFFRRCLESAKGNPQQEAAVYSGLIRVLWLARKYDALAEICQQGLQQAQATNHLLFHQYRARALVLLGRAEEALAEANRAVEIANDETRLETRLNRVSILAQAERFPEALAEAEALAKEYRQPEQVHAIRDSLHNVYTAMHDFAKAEEQLHLILHADPDDATANNNLGYLWADQGKNLPEAERFIRKALELDRQQKKSGSAVSLDGDADNAAFVDSLGWVLFREGQFEEARTWLEKATELTRGEDDPTVWDHLGDVYFRLGKPRLARSSWEKALHLYEAEKRRKMDEHAKELKHKLELLDAQTGAGTP